MSRFPRFRQLDGSHPFQREVPGGYIEYGARRIRGAEVVYFNFLLAQEMGLLPARHPQRLTSALRRTILDTFSLEILNEYHLRRCTPVRVEDRLPGRYMATRYLQLQHPGRRGRTSGDGRSVWNGTVRWRGRSWDVSSCGTGSTRLSPATAWSNRFYKTGSRAVSYGCGTASVEDGLAAALMSETFHANGIATERVLAVLELPNGYAINVRAAPNLIRPSHFFVHLKQGNLAALRGLAALFLERQVRNGVLPRRRGPQRWSQLAESIARTFARTAALFESEYVFCWLDWDGDNVLADGGIIDYGSVRQFGLFHREYRFDDGPRWSTTIPEQRRKARLIVQNFVQIRDFLRRGRLRPLARFARDRTLRVFDAEFDRALLERLLHNVGFEPAAAAALLRRHEALVRRFRREHAYFERARAARGPRRVPDGITWNAIFSTRDVLRELPGRLLRRGEPLPAAEFLELAASTYASRADRSPTPARRRRARAFQLRYLELVAASARDGAGSVPRVL
ncbi:MAG TPA: hypothetical protein VJS92_13330, partial [Candidatus Polarisedimenticolaceae bacterium]|nr:hypothetical protein [Candidatus Polarisedimenticolaceae bacterium]